uniref:Cysteine and glycine-rich protein 1 (Trinotate prediction) n=1 Tax=Henneguya salminicola TaxID=69463 RepID=A0A6G3MJ87_HENSL
MTVTCPVCSKNVYFTDEVRFEGTVFHQRCLTCIKCKKVLTVFNAKKLKTDIYCEICYKLASASMPIEKKTTSKETGGKASSFVSASDNICPVCSQKVYFAESALALSKVCMLFNDSNITNVV